MARDVIPYDAARGHLLPLPAVNLPLTVEGLEGRKVFLYSHSAKAQAARLRAIEGLVASGAAITEVEKSDAEYLKNCVPMKKN